MIKTCAAVLLTSHILLTLLKIDYFIHIYVNYIYKEH